MALYLIESYDYEVFHAGAYTQGVVGEGRGSEKLYLHVLDISDADIASLKAREDEHGNKQSDRRALPMNEEWWIAVAGEKAWPKLPLPRLVSHCKEDQHGIPRPQPLDANAIAALRQQGVKLPG